MHAESDREDHSRLRSLFDAHYQALMAYARRRTGEVADAEEVVAETFVVAWRRLADLPSDQVEQLAWLYAIAYRVILNQRRSARRRLRLLDRLRHITTREQALPSRLPAVTEALARLSETDQEILRLVIWEGLSHAAAGRALGISANAATIRLHRARSRLARKMGVVRGPPKGSQRIRTWMGWKGSASSPMEREDRR